MTQVFKIGSYWVYFWSNENNPLEPIHVHVAEGSPTENATKNMDYSQWQDLSMQQ